jgi:hypothetical protein
MHKKPKFPVEMYLSTVNHKITALIQDNKADIAIYSPACLLRNHACKYQRF